MSAVEPLSWPGQSDCAQFQAVCFSLSGALIFDVGANGGHYTRHWAKTFDRVIALEPNPHSFAALNADLPKDNITTLNVAASDTDEPITLFNEPGSHAATGQYVSATLLNWGETDEGVEVPATRLDHLAWEHGTPDVVKIDVEGHEARVLDGAHHLLKDHQTRWLIEIHSRKLGVECRAMLEETGHEIQRINHVYKEASPYFDEHYYIDAR